MKTKNVKWLLMYVSTLLLALNSCGTQVPPKLPATVERIKTVNGKLQLHITSIIHPECNLQSFVTGVLPAFSGTNNSADKIYLRDDDGAGKDDDVSLDLDILVYQPKVSVGTRDVPKHLKAPWNASRYNIITDSEDSNALAGATDVPDWLIIVQSLPSPELARGAVGKARMLIASTVIRGDTVAHELGHNFGLAIGGYPFHRDFVAPNGKRAIMHTYASPEIGGSCLLSPEEKRYIIEHNTPSSP